VLKSGYARSVYLEPGSGVVKRFHHPGTLQACFDRRRAAAEERLLAALGARALPVPRPLGVRRRNGAWELVMQEIEGALELGKHLELLAGSAERGAIVDAATAELAGRVGTLVGRLHRAGLDHPDLHPGNLLVDPRGALWLVDVHGARLAARPVGRAVAERDLVALLAYLRELLDPAARARLLEAWFAASELVPAPLCAELALDLEARARFQRRAWVARAAGRWWRDSSLAVAHAFEQGVLHARRGVPRERALALYREPAAVGLLALRDGLLRQRFEAAARLEEHRVPCAAPLLCGPGLALFELPPSFETLAVRALAPEEQGALLGALHDRGLALDLAKAHAFRGAAGALLLAPPASLASLDPRPRRIPLAERFHGLPESSAEPAFRRAYAHAFRGCAAESAELARELGP
jgi:tRNA A-37 threonylcarbamoyl transferase component Bud32